MNFMIMCICMLWIHSMKDMNLLISACVYPPIGGVYTCGKGTGILGHGNPHIRTVPQKVMGLKVSESSLCCCVLSLCSLTFLSMDSFL